MHDLIKDNQIIKSNDFNSQTPPILHTNKGKWVPRITINPDIDSAKQTKSLTKTVNEDSTTWTYIAVDIPLETIKKTKLAEIAEARYQAEIAGITVGDSTIKTDRESQALITGAWTTAQINPAVSINWKGSEWVTLDATAITAIATAVSGHVQACFDKEKVKSDLINYALTADAVLVISWED